MTQLLRGGAGCLHTKTAMLGFDSIAQFFICLGVAVAAGAANAIAGGGTNIAFPALLWVGLSPIRANATSAVGLWPGSLGGSWSYHRRILGLERRWLWLLLPSLAGGGLGAYLLVHLPPSWFRSVAPFFILGSAILIALEPVISKTVGGSDSSKKGFVAGIVIQFLVSVYGGYFGAGIGLLLLTALGVMGLRNLQDANALKNLLSVVLKGVAVFYFIVIQRLVWHVALVMMVGSVFGGFFGGVLVKRVNPSTLRWIASGVGGAMGVILLIRH